MGRADWSKLPGAMGSPGNWNPSLIESTFRVRSPVASKSTLAGAVHSAHRPHLSA
jgi:hypothetical protein